MADLFEEVQQNLQEHFKSAAAPETIPAPVQETAPVTTQETIPVEAAAPVIPETSPAVAPPVPAPSTVEYYKELGFESPDHLKSSLNDLKTKAEEYDKKLPYYSELEKEFENAMKLMDPLAPNGLFKGDEKKYDTFLKAMKVGEGKDMDNPSVFSVVNRIASTDLDKISDMDVVNLQWQYDAPRFAGSDETIKKEILKQLGVDTEDSEFKLEAAALSPGQDLTLSRMAQAAREKFNQAKASVQRPERPDYKKAINDQIAAKAEAEKQNKEKFNKMAHTWEETVKRLPESTYKFEVMEKNDKNEDVVDFVFNMEEEFKKEIPEMIMHHVLSNGMEPTQENANYGTDLARRIYISDNWEKLAKAYANQRETKLREKLDKERYNGTDFNTKTPPPGRDEDLSKKINDGVIKIANLKI